MTLNAEDIILSGAALNASVFAGGAPGSSGTVQTGVTGSNERLLSTTEIPENVPIKGTIAINISGNHRHWVPMYPGYEPWAGYVDIPGFQIDTLTNSGGTNMTTRHTYTNTMEPHGADSATVDLYTENTNQQTTNIKPRHIQICVVLKVL